MVAAEETRELADYLALPYTVEVRYDAQDGYFARVVELPGCMTWSNRIEELWPLVEDAKRSWITVAREHGDEIPVPGEPSSRMIPIPLPEDLHGEVARRSRQEGVTVDAFVRRVLTRAIGE